MRKPVTSSIKGEQIMSKLIKTATIIISLTVVFISVICINAVDWAIADEKAQTTKTGIHAREISESHNNDLHNSNKANATVPEQDSLALVALYNSTNGPGLES